VLVAEVKTALCAARWSPQLAGLGTGEFVGRALLLAVIQQFARAAAAARRLG